jgi:hypothetical protein
MNENVFAAVNEPRVIRANIDVTFLAEYGFELARGMQNPALLARTGLMQRTAPNLFLLRVLTPAPARSSRSNCGAAV